MPTKKEIDNKYLAMTELLETEFFEVVLDGDGTKRVLKSGKNLMDFNSQHSNIWTAHESELIANGYLPSKPPPPPDYKKLWTEALTPEAKINVLAKILNLEK